MIALVTIAVFIYRRPFQHLFSAVGYGVIGSRERAALLPVMEHLTGAEHPKHPDHSYRLRPLD
jgi:hypothetical protein